MKRREKKIGVLSLILVFLVLVQPVKAADKKVKKKEEKQPRVTMTFFDTDLREALKEISLQAGVDIIPDQTVGGVVTAKFNNLPLEKALERILASGGYTYRKIEDYYLVGLPSPKSSTFSKLSKVEVVRLDHIKAEKVFRQLPNFFKDYVHGNKESDILTISAPNNKLDRIKGFINKLDKPKEQVKVKVVITEVNSSQVRKLGNKMFSYDEGETIDQQISYNSEDGLLTFGKDYYGEFLDQLKLLEKKHKAEIKADPHLLIADGSEAKLFVGKEENIVIDEDSSDSDSESRIEEIKVGMKLDLAAEVVGTELIDLRLSPEISHFVDEMKPDIIVRKNSLTTSLRLRSGQTAVLAGMTKKNNFSQREGMPILNKIPLLRWLFSSKTKRSQNRELLILVTPVIK